jgi:hypothetical protein
MQARRGVADDIDEGVLAGADQPPGHLVPRRQGEQGVHRRDAQVEPGQELIRPVDPLAVDVQLGAVQQAHPAMFPVDLHSDRMRSCPTSPPPARLRVLTLDERPPHNVAKPHCHLGGGV